MERIMLPVASYKLKRVGIQSISKKIFNNKTDFLRNDFLLKSVYLKPINQFIKITL